MKHWARLSPYLRRHLGAYVVGLLLVVAATACGIAAPLLVKAAVDRLEAGATREFILLASGGIVVFAVVRGLFLFGGRHLILRASRRVEFELRNDLFAHLERLSARWFDTHPTGDITSRAINDLDGVRMMFGIGVMATASTGLLVTAAVSTMVAMKPALAALCLSPLALIAVLMAWAGARMHSLSLAVQDQLGVLSSRAQENFTGARVVRAFVQEDREIGRYAGLCEEYRARNLRLANWRCASWALILVLMEAAILVTLYAGGREMIGGTFSKGEFVAFTAYQFMLIWPMIALGWVVGIAQRGLACMGRLGEIWDAVPEVDDARAVPGPPIRGAIEARNLTFAYGDGRPPALRDVSFRVEPGQKVAIVGRTGAGKSTLVHLLLRLYRVPDGMLFLDGRDVNTIPLADLRGAFGVVPQDLFLFSDRLRENIAFGARDGASEERIVRAAEISRLSADLDQFPDRLDQVIGERGVTLSGGQKQRAALARALVREPAILVLDDALSSVDAHTEIEIRERLRDFLKGRTCLVITHRLSAVTDADRILVLDEGRRVEEGRHEELVARGGLYATLWESQKLAEELSEA